MLQVLKHKGLVALPDQWNPLLPAYKKYEVQKYTNGNIKVPLYWNSKAQVVQNTKQKNTN
jgi:hypothetical protein